MARRRAASHGTTFVELLVTMVILAILASAILPIAEASRRREQEIELRRALRDMRQALLIYHALCVQTRGAQGGGMAANTLVIKIENDLEGACYPEDLDVLIEGVETNVPDFKLRFLRRIPRDPFNLRDEEHDQHGWRLVSTTDNLEGSLSWDRNNVMDVRSASGRRALDGSFYKDW